MAGKRVVEEPASPMTPAYVGPGNEMRQIPVSKLIVDPAGMILPSYVEIARAKLFQLRHGSRDFVPKVFARPDGRYAIVHFEVA